MHSIFCLQFNQSLVVFSFKVYTSLVQERQALVTVLCIVIVVGSVMYLIEGPEGGFTSIPRGVYWAIVTLTSVGYGDCYPVTPGGRIFTGLLLPVGLGVITVPSGLLAYGLTKSHEMRTEVKQPAEVDSEGDHLEMLEAVAAELNELRRLLNESQVANQQTTVPN